MAGQIDILRLVTDVSHSVGHICVVETRNAEGRVLEYGLIAMSFDSCGWIDQVVDIRPIEGNRGANRLGVR